jgi:hypothetical protein
LSKSTAINCTLTRVSLSPPRIIQRKPSCDCQQGSCRAQGSRMTQGSLHRWSTKACFPFLGRCTALLSLVLNLELTPGYKHLKENAHCHPYGALDGTVYLLHLRCVGGQRPHVTKISTDFSRSNATIRVSRQPDSRGWNLLLPLPLGTRGKKGKERHSFLDSEVARDRSFPFSKLRDLAGHRVIPSVTHYLICSHYHLKSGRKKFP